MAGADAVRANGVHRLSVDEVLLNIRSIRLARGIGADEVAGFMNNVGDTLYTEAMYEGFETGRLDMSVGEFLHIAAALDVKPECLLHVGVVCVRG